MLLTKTIAPAAPAGLVEVICNCGVQAELPGEGMRPLELGAKVKLAAPVARDVCAVAGRAFYVSTADDPSLDKRFSLTPERQAAIECEKAARKARAADMAEEQAFARAARRELIARYGVGV